MLKRLRRLAGTAEPTPLADTVPERDLNLPAHIAVILANPRSGSTWLFDMMRSHPAIDMLPGMDVFLALGMSSRRYPRDLITEAVPHRQVEVKPGQWEPVPTFTANLPHDGRPQYALEKCHPHFFNHQVYEFALRVRALQAQSTIKMIFLVRDPHESLVSFWRYQQRKPDWNSHIDADSLPDHMRRIYESLLAVSAELPGLVIDYADLAAQPEAVLTTTTTYLWPNRPALTDAHAAAIIRATARDARPPTPFLGDQTTDLARDADAFAAVLERHTATLDACDAAYHQLLSLRDGATS